MIFAIIETDLHLPGNASLKDKRQVLQSLKTGLRNKFNVSVAETGSRDLWQRAELGLAVVAGDRSVLENEVSRILDFIHCREGVVVIKDSVEYI